MNPLQKMIEQEPDIIINGVKLDFAQAMSVRVAVSSFRINLSDPEHREALGLIGDSYDKRLAEVERIMLRSENDIQ